MCLGRIDWYARALRIAAAHKYSDLEFIVQALARPKYRPIGAFGQALALRPPDRLFRDPDRGDAAVIADRHPGIVRRQWIIGPEQLAHGQRVMLRRVEIRV